MALNGNGTSQYLGLGTATVITRNLPLTVIALVDSASIRTSGNWSGIIGQGDYNTSGGMSFQLEISAAASPQLTFSASQSGGTGTYTTTGDSTGGPTITPNTGWWLVAACVRKTTNTLSVQYYAYRFNTGTLTTAAGGTIGFVTATTQLAPPAASAITAVAAEGEISVTDWWPGAFGWCGVWNADLSESQSANPTPIWTAITEGPLAIADSTLAGLWILDNGDAHDYSAGGHNGTYQASPTFIGTPVNYLPLVQAYHTTDASAAGSNPLAGTGSVVSSGTGNLLQTEAIAGSGAIVTSGTGAIIQTQPLAASGAITTAGTANLTQTQLLAGTGAITAAGTATLRQTQALAGSGAITTGGSAALVQTQTLAGTGGIVTGGSAALSLGGSNTLAGTGAIVSGGTANLTQVQPLAGSGAIVAAGTAVLAQTQTLTGTGAVVSSGTAVLSNAGTGSGTANFAIGVKTAGNGAQDMSPAVVRDSSNRLWRASATTGSTAFDNSTGQYNGNTLRMFRADQDQVPSSFTEQDSAHRPTNVGSFSIAIDGSDLIHVAFVHTYAASTTGIFYATFNTSTNLWGTTVQIGTVNYASTATYTLGDAGVALALDASGVPHVVSYGQTSGTGATHIFYTNHVSGSWSTAVQLDTATLGANQRCMHPACMFDSTGALHVAWMTITFNYGTTLEHAYYIKRSSGGTFGSVTQFAENLLGSIDNGPSLYVSEDDHIHIAYGLGDGSNPSGQAVTGTTVNNSVFYRFSSDGGVTWNTTTQPAHYVSHDFSLGPDGFGGIHLWSHSQPTTVDGLGTAIGYASLAKGSSSWVAWAQKANDANGNGFDCTVSPRRETFFRNRPAYLDIAFFDLNLPASAMLGSDPAGNALVGQVETGAITSAGTASLSVIVSNALAGTGGIVSNGSAAVLQTQALAGRGDIVSSGTATATTTAVLAGSGAIVSSGTATLLQTQALGDTGAIVSGGNAHLVGPIALAGTGAIVSNGTNRITTNTGVLQGVGGIASNGFVNDVGSPNRIKNGSFETNVTPFAPIFGGSAAQDLTQSFVGNASMAVTFSSTANSGVGGVMANPLPNGFTVISAYVKRTETTAIIRMKDSAATFTVTVPAVLGWQRVSMNANISGFSTITVQFTTTSTGMAGVVMYVDGLQMESGTTPTYYQDNLPGFYAINAPIGTGAITSNGTGVLTPSGTMTGVGNIVSNGTASAVVLRPLAGAGAIASNGTADLSITENVSGTGTITSSGTGALVLTYNLGGTGAIISNGNAAMGVQNLLSGTGAISSNSPSAPSTPANPLSGTAAIVSNGSATITQTHVLSGTGAIVSNGTSALTPTIVFSGQGDLVSHGTGLIAQIQPLAGSGAVVSGGTATLTNISGMSGTGNIVSSTSGALSQVNVLAPSSAHVVSNGTGAITYTYNLSGTGGSVSGGTASIVQAQALTGQGAITSSGSTVLAGGVPLAGTGGIVSNGSAVLTDAITLAGTGAMSTLSAGAPLTIIYALAGHGALVSNGAATITQTHVLAATPIVDVFAVTSDLLRQVQSLIGTGALQSSVSGALGQTQNLGAQGDVTTAGTANLTSATPLAGVGGIVSSGAAVLSIARSVLGTGHISSNGSGNLTQSGFAPLSGTGDVVTSGSAALVLIQPLLGSGAVVTSGSALLSNVTHILLSGTGGVQSSGVAPLSVTRLLDGQGAVTVTGTGTLRQAQALTATGAVTSSGTADASILDILYGTTGVCRSAGTASMPVFAPLGGVAHFVTAGTGNLSQGIHLSSEGDIISGGIAGMRLGSGAAFAELSDTLHQGVLVSAVTHTGVEVSSTTHGDPFLRTPR